jgi:hypothetical protein
MFAPGTTVHLEVFLPFVSPLHAPASFRPSNTYFPATNTLAYFGRGSVIKAKKFIYIASALLAGFTTIYFLRDLVLDPIS